MVLGSRGPCPGRAGPSAAKAQLLLGVLWALNQAMQRLPRGRPRLSFSGFALSFEAACQAVSRQERQPRVLASKAFDSLQSSAFPGAGPATPSPVREFSEGPGNGLGSSQAFSSDLLQLGCGRDVSPAATACLGLPSKERGGLTALVFQCLQFQHVQSSTMRSVAGEKIEPRWSTSLFSLFHVKARQALYWGRLGFAGQQSLLWGFYQLYLTGWLPTASQRASQGRRLSSLGM